MTGWLPSVHLACHPLGKEKKHSSREHRTPLFAGRLLSPTVEFIVPDATARLSSQGGNSLDVSSVRIVNRVHYLNLTDRAFCWCFDTWSADIEVSWDGEAKKVVADTGCVGAKGGAQDRFVTAFHEIVGAVFPEAAER